MTVDGRDAIKIVVSARGDEVYLVDATTYDPIEWQTRGTDGGVTLRFAAYERLPLSADNEALLSLEEQHPGATVDGDPAHYSAALDRRFPNG